jgi:anti-sigma B factor antagonist
MLTITDRTIDGVVILELSGKMIIGVGDVMLREAIKRLLDKKTSRVIVSLADVAYADSAGLTELVRSYSTVSRAGGRLVLAGITRKLTDLLQITKLLTVFDRYDTVEKALASFGRVLTLEVACPVHACGGWARWSHADAGSTLRCRMCETDFETSLSASLAPTPAAATEVTRIQMETYEQEYVSVDLGRPVIVRCVGRLDLFASGVLERVYASVPVPRRLLLDLEMMTEASAEGIETIVRLCRDAGTGFAILRPPPKASLPERLTGQGRDSLIEALGTRVTTYPDRAAAIAAIGDGSGPPPIIVSVRRVS